MTAMTSRACRVCGDTGETDPASNSNFARFRRLLGPKWRAVSWGFRDFICWRDERRAHYQIKALEALRVAREAARVLEAS